VNGICFVTLAWLVAGDCAGAALVLAATARWPNLHNVSARC
jgi:hypothetical protein